MLQLGSEVLHFLRQCHLLLPEGGDDLEVFFHLPDEVVLTRQHPALVLRQGGPRRQAGLELLSLPLGLGELERLPLVLDAGLVQGRGGCHELSLPPRHLGGRLLRQAVEFRQHRPQLVLVPLGVLPGPRLVHRRQGDAVLHHLGLELAELHDVRGALRNDVGALAVPLAPPLEGSLEAFSQDVLLRPGLPHRLDGGPDDLGLDAVYLVRPGRSAWAVGQPLRRLQLAGRAARRRARRARGGLPDRVRRNLPGPAPHQPARDRAHPGLQARAATAGVLLRLRQGRSGGGVPRANRGGFGGAADGVLA